MSSTKWLPIDVMPDPLWKMRLKHLLFLVGFWALIGLGYLIFVWYFGFGVPCLFHLITGLKCPGCGVTRMVLSLAQLQFQEAWNSNAALLCLLPVGAVLAVDASITYVRTGNPFLHKWQKPVIWCIIVLLLIFGILRNIPL